MTDEELKQAIAELQEVVRCRCHEAYRDRGLKDPHCECDSAEAVKIVAAPNLKRIGTGIYETQPTPDHAAIREAWEKAYWRMRSYAVHDNDCKLNKPPRFDGPCSCGLTAALEEALALIPKGAADERA